MAASDKPWRVGDATSRLLLDVAAGRPVAPLRPLNGYQTELAVRHGLMGLMADSSDPLLRSSALPIFARLQARQQVMERNLRRLLGSLAAAGVRATVVKGPHLAQSVYADPAHRTYTDLDILVHPDDLAASLDVLRDDEVVSSIPPKTPKADKRNIPMSDESGVLFTVDLHWDLFSYSQLRGCADGAVEWAWTHARVDPDHPLGPLWELPPEAYLAFLTTHAIFDHRFRLILFRDLVEVACRGVDWEAFDDFTRRWKLRGPAHLSLLIATRSLGAPIGEDELQTLRPGYLQLRWVERALARTDLLRFDGHRTHLVNLGIVTSHDRYLDRLQLTATAPRAFPGWRERVRGGLAARTRGGSVLNVVHVLPRDLARGAQTYARALSDHLDSPSVRHWTVALYAAEPSVLRPDIELELRMGRLRTAGFDPRVAFRLHHVLRSIRPNVIVAHGGEPLKYCFFAAPHKSALIYYKIGSARALFGNWIRRAFHRVQLSRADLVAGVSPEMVEEVRILLKVPSSKTVYIPNGRDPSSFGAPLREDLGSDSVTYVFVGQLTRTKRPEVFVELIAALQRRGVDARGIMVGDGPLMESLKAGNHAGVEFLGRRDDVPAILARTDIFVFTSVAEGEGMPGVVIEAGFAGLPVVATRVPGLSTVVDDGVTGFLVDVDDFAGMVESADFLARDIALRHRMGQAARLRCEREFSLDVSLSMWESILGRWLGPQDDIDLHQAQK